MQTLKTIVATAVITLAATTVAVAGVGKVSGQNTTAPTPAPAVTAHQQQTQAGYALRLTDAQVKQFALALSTKVKTERGHERQVVRHRNDAQHAHAGLHAYASAGYDAAHAGTRTQRDEPSENSGEERRSDVRPDPPADARPDLPADARPRRQPLGRLRWRPRLSRTGAGRPADDSGPPRPLYCPHKDPASR